MRRMDRSESAEPFFSKRLWKCVRLSGVGCEDRRDRYFGAHRQRPLTGSASASLSHNSPPPQPPALP